jgi:hypothetical protein
MGGLIRISRRARRQVLTDVGRNATIVKIVIYSSIFDEKPGGDYGGILEGVLL